MQCVILFSLLILLCWRQDKKKKRERERKRSNAGSLDWLRAGRELRNERTESMSVMQTGNLVAV